MLSTLLALTGFYTYSQNPGAAWWLFACVTFLSAYGQLYNQLRDFKMDKLAKLKNTAILLGQKNAKVLMYTALSFCIFSFVGAVLSGLFPVWLIIIVTLILPASKMFRSKVDMSGKAYFEKSGAMQMQLLVVANIVVAIWIFQVLFSQIFLK
jgi:4-hydroxybenzoate polyprenyltransferase